MSILRSSFVAAAVALSAVAAQAATVIPVTQDGSWNAFTVPGESFLPVLDALRDSAGNPRRQLPSDRRKVALTVLSSYDEKIRNAKIDLAKTYTNRFVDQALKTVQ